MTKLHLISHALCPYVQRAIITLIEKKAPHERTYIDLANKPDWFLAVSPLGKTPVLQIDDRESLFESAIICDYLDETIINPPLHPKDPLKKAKHRAWVEFGSAILNDIAGLYLAPNAEIYTQKIQALDNKFGWVERALENGGPYFSGASFSLVDAAFGPVFRYFDVFETFTVFPLFEDKAKVRDWRKALADRPSIHQAVMSDYNERLLKFLKARNSYISTLI